ncbi:hypothetical protein ACTXJK_18040 [Brachybacterium tyrofermentans]
MRVASLRALAAGGEIEHAPAVLRDADASVVRAAERALEAMESRLDRPLS